MSRCCLSELQVVNIVIQHNNGYFQSKPLFSGKQYNFDQMNEFCLYQSSVVTSFQTWWTNSKPLQLCKISSGFVVPKTIDTRRPASADRTARRQFQATGQQVSRTQASDAMTSRLPRNEAKCVQRRCFQCGSVPLRSNIKGTELPPTNILIPLERQLIALQLCR